MQLRQKLPNILKWETKKILDIKNYKIYLNYFLTIIMYIYMCVCVCVLGCSRYLDPRSLPVYSNDILLVLVQVHMYGKLKPRPRNVTAKSAYSYQKLYLGKWLVQNSPWRFRCKWQGSYYWKGSYMELCKEEAFILNSEKQEHCETHL